MALGGLVGCAGGDEAAHQQDFRREFRIVYERYQQFEPEKSLALARDESGEWAYGYAQGFGEEIKAVNEAITRCQRQRSRYGVTSRCRTYAVGNDITGDPALVADPPAQR